MLWRNKEWVFLIYFSLSYYSPAQADDTLYLEVIINGQNTQRIVQFFRSENEWLLDSEDFSALGLKMEFPHPRRVSLNEIEGLEAVYDYEFQRLILTVPSQLLPVQYFSANLPQRKGGGSLRDTGSFINYSVVSTSGNMNPSVSSLWHEYHFFDSDFIFLSSGIYQHNADSNTGSDYTRFETYYQRDNESDLSETIIGDVINATPNWGRSIRMAGIRFARDYELDPTFITYPLPEFYGESALPGSVDLIINDQLRWSEPITPGPFLINMAPYLSGAGVAQVVTTNAQGQQVQKAVDFYVTSQLLAPDIFDYDLTLGFRRKDFGFLSNSYAHSPVVSNSFRYGLNKHLTPQLLLQAGEGLLLGGAGITALAGSMGVVDVAGVSSSYKNQNGKQASVSYNYHYKKIGINASYLRRYGNYRDLGTQDILDSELPFLEEDPLKGALRNTQMQVAASLHDNILGGFNLAYFRTLNSKNEQKAVVNFSWSRYFFSNITAFANLGRQLHGRRENWISFTLSIPFGASGQFSTMTQRDMKGELRSQVQAMTNPSRAEGFGWGANMEDSQDKNRYFTGEWRNRYSDVSLSAYYSGDQTEYTKAVHGALILMDGDFYATRFVSDSFALVDTRQKEVPVMLGNQFVGRTDAEGKLLVPDLSSYLENRIAIDPMLLPANASMDSIEQLVIPRRSGGAHVKFPIRFSQSALAEVITIDGKPLPAGATLYAVKGAKRFIAGWNGEVYLEDLSRPLILFWDEGECFVELLPAEDEFAALPRIGPFVCETAWRPYR